jgi:hypothetical protein
MKDDHPDAGSRVSAAEAIKNLLRTEGALPPGAYVSSCVVVAAVNDEVEGTHPRTETVYPLGAPDPLTERVLLERALDSLREDGDRP